MGDFDSLFAAYKNCVRSIEFSGPTMISPLLKEVNKFAAASSRGPEQNYVVLLILTDGIINDMQASIDRIVEGSMLPLSIIIIGIGQADFGKMNRLDADDEQLISSRQQKAQRDIV